MHLCTWTYIQTGLVRDWEICSLHLFSYFNKAMSASKQPASWSEHFTGNNNLFLNIHTQKSNMNPQIQKSNSIRLTEPMKCWFLTDAWGIKYFPNITWFTEGKRLRLNQYIQYDFLEPWWKWHQQGYWPNTAERWEAGIFIHIWQIPKHFGRPWRQYMWSWGFH